MAESGNPALAAQKRHTDEVRAAVREGKSLVLHPFPNTKVIVQTTDEEEAVQVATALQPAPDNINRSTLDSYLFHSELFLTAASGDPKFKSVIKDFLARLQCEL